MLYNITFGYNIENVKYVCAISIHSATQTSYKVDTYKEK